MRSAQRQACAALCVDNFVDLPFGALQRPLAIADWEKQLASRQGLPNHEWLVASEDCDGEVVGCVECGLLPPPPEKNVQTSPMMRPEEPYLANLAVATSKRKRGVGTQLIAAVESRAAEWGYRRLLIKVDRGNFDARRLYDRLGYSLVYLQASRPDVRNRQTVSLYLAKELHHDKGGG